MSEIPLILFAKVPEPGKVKTRLSPELDFHQASEVAKILLSESLSFATKYWPGTVVLAIWPTVNNNFIQQQLSQYQVPYILQVEGDLGVKMDTAMQSQGFPCAVMGCDVPHLEASELMKAHQLLLDGNNVIGPTQDGGYYLLGLQQRSPGLFKKQLWGEDQVLQQSQKVAEEQKIELISLSIVDDIDTFDDLLKASRHMKSLQRFVKSCKVEKLTN